MSDEAEPKKRGRPRTRPVETDPIKAERLEKGRAYRNEYNKANNALARDIGPLRDCLNPARVTSCERDFRLFCETYLAPTFSMGWSADHLRVIKLIETAVLQGKLYAFAMARASGKTSLCEAACIWALVYAHRKFIVLIGSDADAAAGMLATIRAELESNDELDEDFPHVTQPIRALEGIAHRANGQILNGERTAITWNTDEIILPTVEGAATSGSIVKVCGITGRIRGMAHKTRGGAKLRPDLVIIDDPQTDESANSIQQCATREAVLNGAVLGLAGPGKKIAGFLPCTVIRPGDLADTILDRKKYPEWQGTRFRLMEHFPKNLKLWETYAELRAHAMENESEEGMVAANQYYIDNRKEMDEGAVVAWEDRKNPDEISAIQHAMNLYYRNPAAFMSEYQNDPYAKKLDGESEILYAADVLNKVVRLPRGTLPQFVTHLTMFIDVGETCLYWAICGWGEKFQGHVVDYGTYPDQKVVYFKKADVKRHLKDLLPDAGIEAQIHKAITLLCNWQLTKTWKREDGVEVTIERCLIDSGHKPDTIHEYCRTSSFPTIVMPSRGFGISAKGNPLCARPPAQGERVGLNWRIPAFGAGRRLIRYVQYDTNFWKTFMKNRWKAPMQGNGSLTLFETPKEFNTHRLFADHLTAEYFVKVAANGREVDEWQPRPERNDNDWLDCIVGNCVAASLQGVILPELAASTVKERKRISFSEMQRRRQMEKDKKDGRSQ